MITQNGAPNTSEPRGNVDAGWSKKGKTERQILVWSDGHKKGGNVPLPWMMDVGAFQARGVRFPPVL